MRYVTKRIYDPAAQHDGARILVDRVWPRGIKKDDAKLDLWLKDIAPSTELRKWFNHDVERFEEFARRYRAELQGNEAVAQLEEFSRGHRRVTLLFGAHDEEHNQAIVLADFLSR